MFDPEINEAIRQLITQWNKAERRIKKAEQVRANQVVGAAVAELRYAGRKFIDASELLLDAPTDPSTKAKALEYLADATEDCVKAKHDAIDSMLDFITAWFDRTENKLGLSAVVRFFPNYIEITAQISTIQDKIAESRFDRNKLRDGIYNEIEDEHYGTILALYNTIRQSEPRVQAEVDAEVQEKEHFDRRVAKIHYEGRLNLALGVGGLVVGAIGFIFAVVVYLRPG